jgi:hypothetical protein
MQGHFNYFGVSGNYRGMRPLVEATERNWFKWLRRRSNRTRLTWQKFAAILKRYPLPTPQIHVRIWGELATSRISGGAGWGRSPSPDLERALGE